MDGIFALSFLVLAIIIALISTVATIIVGIAIANFLGLSGVLWWAFLIVFWCVISSITGKASSGQ